MTQFLRIVLDEGYRVKLLGRSVFLVVFVFSSVFFAMARTPEIYLDVRDLKVTFVSVNTIKVSGELRGRGISRIPDDDPSSGISVEARVDLLGDNSAFSLVPTGWVGRSTEDWIGNIGDEVYLAYWYHQGKRYFQRNTMIPIYGTSLMAESIIDKTLDEDQQDGRWITFEKTLDFDRALAKNRRKYRVIIGLTYDFTGPVSFKTFSGNPFIDVRFQEKYWWVIYGPFDWGDSPAGNVMLTARHGKPVSFTDKGVIEADLEVLKEPEADGKTEGDKPTVEQKAARKKLNRPATRPSHLEAVDAAGALQQKLNAMPGVESSTIGLPPTAALLNINYVSGLKPEDLTELATEIVIETAYAAPWVDSIRMSLNGDHGSTSVTVSWNTIVAFTNGDTTLSDFFQTWEIGGKPLVAPVPE